MGARIDAIRKREQMSPQEVMAGYLWHFVVKGKDHFLKLRYYDFPCYFEFWQDNAVFLLDVYYLGQLETFTLLQPDYNSVLGAAPAVLEWLESTYATFAPPKPPRISRRTRVANRQ